MTEVYGYKKTRQIIIASLLSYMFFMLSSQAVIALPPADEWHLQAQFETIFGQAPRVFIGGCLAYLAGELSNSYIMSHMKVKMDGRHFWLRAMVSTLVGEAANTCVFQFTAFWGVMPALFLVKVVTNGTIAKCIVEAVVLPLTAFICRRVKAGEGIDYFDHKPPAQTV